MPEEHSDRAGWDPREWAMSLIPIVVAMLPLGITLYRECDPEARAWSGSTAFFVLFWTFAICAALNAWLLWHHTVTRNRVARYEELSELLDKCLRNESLAIDPLGELNARMNVMTVHRWSRPVWLGFVRYPLLWALQRLYPVACTEGMRGSPDAGLGWRRGNGCVGQLWATGDQIACAAPVDEAARREFKLSKEQATKTHKLQCIVSVAILTDVIGVDQQLLGYLNLDSDVEDSVEAWTLEGKEVGPALAARLIAVTKAITRGDYLP